MAKRLGFLFLCLVWGTTWIAIKISLGGLPPFYGAAARFSVAVLVLYVFAKIVKTDLSFNRNYLIIVSLSSFLMYVFDYGLVYWAEQYLSAGVTSIFFATFALFTVFWTNFIFRNEVFRWNTFGGILAGLIGILVVFYNQLVLTQFDRMVLLACIAIVLGAAGGAMAVVLIKKYAQSANPVALTLHQMLFGIFFLLIFGLIFESTKTFSLTPQIITAVIYLGLFGSAIAFTIYYWMLKKMSAITLSTIIYITPIVAVVFDFFIMGEKISSGSVGGAIIIFSGIALSQAHQWSFLRKLLTQA